MLLVWVCVAFAEEWLARGLILRLIERAAGSWVALMASAAIFGLMHAGNPNAGVVSTIGVVLGGFLLGAAYLATRALWLPIGLHLMWNMFQNTIFAVSVSGNQVDQTPLLRGEVDGPSLWTGGEFGAEAGLPGLVVPTVLGIIMVIVAVRRGNIQPLRNRATVQHRNVEHGGETPAIRT